LFICSYEIIDIAVVAVMEIIISFRLNSFVLVIENSVPTMSKKYWIGNNRKAPATLHTTRSGGADWDGHPGRVKAREGGKVEDEMGAGIY